MTEQEIFKKLNESSTVTLEGLRTVTERNIKHYQDQVLPNETFDQGVRNERRKELQAMQSLVKAIDKIQVARMMEYLGK